MIQSVYYEFFCIAEFGNYFGNKYQTFFASFVLIFYQKDNCLHLSNFQVQIPQHGSIWHHTCVLTLSPIFAPHLNKRTYLLPPCNWMHQTFSVRQNSKGGRLDLPHVLCTTQISFSYNFFMTAYYIVLSNVWSSQWH